MKNLIGLNVQLITNGDITILDLPESHEKECFGPTHGSQHTATGVIVEAEPVVEISHEWLENSLNGINEPIQYEIRIHIKVSLFGKIYRWTLLPETVNYLLNRRS